MAIAQNFHFRLGVRQADPISPYLFILCLEFLSAALKNHPDIQGIHINNSEYLISQYADDSAIILEDDDKSLNVTLEFAQLLLRLLWFKA